MRYPPQVIERLAAEYVLGTLRGRARRRMESLMRQRSDVRLAVWDWERRFGELTADLEPVSPPAAIWHAIARRIAPARSPHKAPARRWWQPLALALPAVAALAFWLGTLQPGPEPPAQQVAVVVDSAAQPLWILRPDAGERFIVAESRGVPAAGEDRVYELWALPAGDAPRSLGILDNAAGRYELPLDTRQSTALQASAAVAISLEPPGGSHTGAPTGPIVYQASLVRF